MKFTRHLPVQTRRDAWVEVDLGAMEQNVKKLMAQTADKAVLGIVKADAYGHGAIMAIPTLEASGVSMVGVASIDEAIQIREAGLEIPILVIGAIPDWAVQAAAEHDIALTIFDAHHLESLRQSFAQAKKPVKTHIKVDTGMHRIGVPWQDAAAFVSNCRTLPQLQLEGIFSHLASPEDSKTTTEQLERWNTVLDQIERDGGLPKYTHIASSVGALLHPQARGNLIRLGIGIFGYGDSLHLGLKPAMSLKARILRLEEVPPDSGISYGHTFITAKPSRIATVPVGYADGIPRVLSNKIEGILNGKRIKQVGTITMDQLMFDVSDIDNARLGDTITLIGRDGQETITLSDWAQKANTIEYELMCALRVRLPKTYTRD